MGRPGRRGRAGALAMARPRRDRLGRARALTSRRCTPTGTRAWRPGHPARAAGRRPARRQVRRRRWRRGSPGAGCCSPPYARRRSPGCSRWPSSTGPTASATSWTPTTSTSRPPGRPTTCRTPWRSYVSRIPLRRGTATTGRCTSPATRPGRCSFFVGAGPARARQRPRRRAGGHAARRHAPRSPSWSRCARSAPRRWRARAAPFLVLGPAAIWQCVSADALFAAVAAWGLAALAVAATVAAAARLAWSVVAGCCSATA